MKTKFYWLALLASAALIVPAQAGGRQQGGGGGFAAPHAGGGAHVAGPGFYSGPRGNFGGGRMIYSGQRFSSFGMRSPSSPAFRQHSINTNGRNFAISHPRHEGNGSGQVRNGNNNPRANFGNHVVAQHSAGWHRDWDRTRDHWWHGHRCRFVNGSWFIFDLGFEPWWPYSYPYDYYPYSYSYDDYDTDAYQGGEYYDQSGNADQYSDSTVATAQERLAQQGYYRGEIDGVFGAQTRRAIMRYQSAHGLRVTGNLNADTLHALGLPRMASNR
jgi:Putative peptidoglycan binding domain